MNIVPDYKIKSYEMKGPNGDVHSTLGSKNGELTLEFLYQGIIDPSIKGQASLQKNGDNYILMFQGRAIMFFTLLT